MKRTKARAEMFLPIWAALFFLVTIAHGAPYSGKTHTFDQPDGSLVELRIFGDEYYARAETPQGYSVIRDELTGWISYAIYDEFSGALISTGIPYESGVVAPVDLQSIVGERHQAPPIENIVQTVNINHKRLLPNSTSVATVRNIDGVLMAGPPQDNPPAPTGEVSGTIHSLTVVVDFSDAPAPLSLDKYEAYFNDLDWREDGNSMSVRRYYREISFGKVELINQVFGIFRAPKTFKAYDAMSYAEGARQIIVAILEQMDSEGFDFSQLTTNENGVIKALNFIYTGRPQSWGAGMWFHQGWVNFSADGVKTGKYACGSANSPLEIFTAVHENGHMIGNWPDTYQYNGNTEPIGNFCVMGGWGKYPPPPNPAFRTMAGWSEVIDITGQDRFWQSFANDKVVHKYRREGSASEYFLVEARQKDSWLHNGLPDSGLTIWRVNTNGDQQNVSHLMVELLHGDNDWNDKNDACFHAGGADTFNDDTTPSANWRGGSRSELNIHSISEAGSNMTFITGSGGCTDTGDNCAARAAVGECVLFPDYMLVNCCESCESVKDDNCPNDPQKTVPGVCGCGVADSDTDGDGTLDCTDDCPGDPQKTDPGSCGCGIADSDTDGDGTLDCTDDCPGDPQKTDPGSCGCGIADSDTDGDGTLDCTDDCPGDPQKTDPGVCGCDEADDDSDGDETPDCTDGCPDDPGKTAPGTTGCGADDCPADPDKSEPGFCGCGVADTDSDEDGTPDCIDECPADPNKSVPGPDGCNTTYVEPPEDEVSIIGSGCSVIPGAKRSKGMNFIGGLFLLVLLRRLWS